MTRDRYLITGTLTTLGPLHVGSGESTRRPGLVNPETKQPIEVNAVIVDHRGRPYLPGTGLKGALRRWCSRSRAPEATVRDLFGSGGEEGDAAGGEGGELGGAAEVWDAPASELAAGVAPDEPAEGLPPLRWWCAERWTEVAPRVAMDRTTGTASHRRLFHDEYVPAGVAFEVGIAARTDEKGAALLLAALAAFGDEESPLTLGADRVNGWGRLSWTPGEIRRLDAAGAKRWLAAGAPTAGWQALEPLNTPEREQLLAAAREICADDAAATLGFDLRLRFDGLFLVNDASRTGQRDERAEREDDADAERGVHPSHAARLDPEGRPLLPASSFRGALRSRAEKILRTVAGEDAACGPGAPRPPCAPPKSREDLERLCPACRLFGAAGWRSPLSVSDFEARGGAESRGVETTQELIAIDRFTGGGAPGLKFKARGFHRPRLSGRIDLDLRALARSGAGLWAFGLLALVLRDLVEGDVAFGFGAGKGFGHARATIEAHRRPDWAAIPERYRAALEAEGLSEEQLRPGAAERVLDQDRGLGIALYLALEALKNANSAAAGGT